MTLDVAGAMQPHRCARKIEKRLSFRVMATPLSCSHESKTGGFCVPALREELPFNSIVKLRTTMQKSSGHDKRSALKTRQNEVYVESF